MSKISKLTFKLIQSDLADIENKTGDDTYLKCKALLNKEYTSEDDFCIEINKILPTASNKQIRSILNASKKSIKIYFATILESWHDPGDTNFDRGLSMCMTVYKKLFTVLGNDYQIKLDHRDDETKLWVLSITFIWIGFLVDIGTNSPFSLYDFDSYADWIDFDGCAYFNNEDFIELLEVEIKRRVKYVFNHTFKYVMDNLGDEQSMDELTSFDNMSYTFHHDYPDEWQYP